MIFEYVLLYLSVSFASCSIVKPEDTEATLLTSSSDPDWWKTATIYQIYPKSFKDSDKDGIGDIRGIISELDYLISLGVQAIWLSPIFESPQKDNGYDISDYRKIWNKFGSIKDFQNLVNDAHGKGLKVIIDFVPNHTSDQHEWFKKSIKNDTEYGDYYVWKNCTVDKEGKLKEPPNNWVSVFGGSAWTYNKDRKQCYLHQFLEQQPDLNYWNENVIKEMQDILNFWLVEQSVDGIRIDAVPHLVENNTYLDEPYLNETDKGAGLNHIYTMNQPQTYELIFTLRNFLDGISLKDKNTRVEFTEATDLKYYGNDTNNGAHFTFNFQFLGLNKQSKAADIGNIIKTYTENLRKLSPDYVPNWVLGNHDTHRIASKVGSEKVDGLNMLTAFLPGIQVTYQGEELGMTNGEVDCEKQGNDFKDDCKIYPKKTRDYERTPFQWTADDNAGFTEGKGTWLPVAKNYKEVNVVAQDKTNSSHLNIYRASQKLRGDLKKGNATNIVEVVSDGDNVLHLRRRSNSKVVFDFLFNIDDKNVTVTLKPKNDIQFLARSKEDNKARAPKGNVVELAGYESVVVFYEPVNRATTFTHSYIALLILGLITRF